MNKVSVTYFKNLDGLRFFSFLAVFLLHSLHSEPFLQAQSSFYNNIVVGYTENGNLGVNCFFVLSGFLITYLLLSERKKNGEINIGAFYIRRVLRIWPLYFITVFVGFVLYVPFRSHFLHQNMSLPPIGYYLFFCSNFLIAKHGPSNIGMLGILWSVAVEEQFYLIWPLLFAFFKPRYFKWIPVFFIAVSWVFRYEYGNNEYETLSCFGDLAIGALGAILIQQYAQQFALYLAKVSKNAIVLLYVLAATIFLFRGHFLLPHWLVPFERTVIALVFLGIILEQNYATNSFYKMSSFRRLSHLGTKTYGLYIYHPMCVIMFTAITRKVSVGHPSYLPFLVVIDVIGAFLVAILVANLSYAYIEQPLLQLKNKFATVRVAK